MCVLCGELVMNVHWTDQPIHDKEYSSTVVVGSTQRKRLRDRILPCPACVELGALLRLKFP